jgi:hypothetical protein
MAACSSRINSSTLQLINILHKFDGLVQMVSYAAYFLVSLFALVEPFLNVTNLFTLLAGVVSTIAGSLTRSEAVVNGWGTNAAFFSAVGVAITTDGAGYVGDETRIRRVAFAGTMCYRL